SGLALTPGEGEGQQELSGQALTYRLAVFVNDVQAAVLEVDESTGTRTIDVPSALLKDEKKHRINFQITGRGQYTYQCILGGFVPAEQLQSTVDDWRVARTYQPAPLEADGREIGRGFGVLEGDYVPFVNPVTQLPVGRRAMVELSVRRKDTSSNVADLEYLVITEPIPSGTTVIEKSVRGPFERFEITPGAITFYVGNRRDIGTIRYELYGYLAGQYRAGPTVIRNAYQAGQLVVSEPKSLAVLPSGTSSADDYRLTPDELNTLGKLYFEKGQWETAEEHLGELFDHWKLNPNAYKSVVKMLLDVHLEVGPAGQVVRYFEIVKEKWPDEEIPFEKIVKVGAAYHEMGEYERSYLIFRATVQTSFLRESGVAGFLDSQGEFVRSVDVMQRLLREYPPEGYLAAGTYALAQRVYAKAPQAAEDEKLRRQKINRVDLIHRASDMLEGFLTAYPDDPAADQAAFSRANTLLELKDYGKVVAACDRYARRYPQSDLLDTYWYIIGYCHFAGSQHEAALAMCRKVAEAKRTDQQTGRQIDSPNKWRAVYIMGQVYHSLGRAAEAVREYERVKDRFSDAARSIAYFLRKGIALPEVTTLRPGEPVEVELKFRNVAACDVKVYRIDLMKFTLMQRNLGGIQRINLAGIRPQHEAAVVLGDGKDYRDRTHKLALPLEKEGAYLVVCRGDDLHASGLVLLTPLAVEVDEDRTAGQVRTTVKDRTTDEYQSDVHVKVIGSGNAKFVAGSTDLRGVFTAEGIWGAATVIAMAEGGRYAFYRGVPERGEGPRLSGTVRRATSGTLPQYRPVDLTADGPEEAEARINAALDSPTQLEFIETQLQDVVDFLRDYHDIEIQIDTRALDEVGIPTDTPITKNLKGVTLRSALRLMLRELDLTYVIQDEVLLITTPEEAEYRLATKVYPVADLVLFRDESGEEWADFDQLIELLTCTVEPTAWDMVGGSGSIAPFENNLSIVVSQSQDVHREIERVLENLRRVGGNKSGDGQPPVRKKPQRGYGGFGGMGMGGMGMGGMGGGGGAQADFDGVQRPFVISVIPVIEPGTTDADVAPAPGGMNELLKGLQEANESFQGQQVDQLQKIYSRGMGMGGFGGVAPGAAF
ncbi:MAG TPA: tetratricopeptide repeat protein, partial [Thermoguttaceae bacterium]|nr:tetratricopeptide repeat protein [Thermoguttaceae bacterium]